MKLSEKIVRLRKSCGMTQEEMAERCAVTRQSISKWEADIALPETEKLLMLSEIFGVSLDTLLRDERTLDAVRENPQCGSNAVQMQKKAMYEGILIKESPEDDPKDNWFADFKAGDRKLSSFTERCSLIQSETKRRRRASARLAGRWAYRMSRCTGKSENRTLSFLIALRRAGKCAILAMR